MDQVDLVETIGDMLTELDKMLISPELAGLPAKWQQVYALRKHLDDQQRELVKQVLDADDVEFKTNAGLIAKAAEQMQAVADQIAKIDQAIDAVSEVSGFLDGILKKI